MYQHSLSCWQLPEDLSTADRLAGRGVPLQTSRLALGRNGRRANQHTSPTITIDNRRRGVSNLREQLEYALVA